MRASLAVLSTALFLSSSYAPVSAASLQVSPVTLDIPAPGSATTLTLNNTGTTPLKAQMRVFRWSMVNGKEHLEPATDVVASPPIAALQPSANYVVRVVRISKAPVVQEETYRLVVDEIPEPSARVKGTVTMAFRYSIPVFFTPQGASSSDLIWSTAQRDGKLYVSATNTGNRRVRLADLAVADGAGKRVTIAKGLAGYVFARQSKSWVAPLAVQKAASPLTVTAQGDLGPIDARALPEASR